MLKELVRKKVIKNLEDKPDDVRNRVVKKVMDNLDGMGVFDPIDFSHDAEHDWEAEVNDHAIMSMDRIARKQAELGIEPDNIVNNTGKGKDIFGKTPLHNAVEMGNIDEARKLIKNGACVLDKDNNGQSCVDLALCNEDTDMLKMFKEEGLSIN